MADEQSREVRVFELTEKGDVDVSYSNVGDLTLTLDIDVSEALTGLKAIQREARKATKALRELEEVQRNTVADDIRRSYE